jgi:hypothetical protein
MLVGNSITTGHHDRVVSSIYSLERKSNKTKRKKALNGLRNNCIHDKVQAAAHPLQRHPRATGKTYISLSSLHPLPKHPLHHLMHLHDLYWSSPRNTPHLRRISPIRHPENLSKPGLLNSITSLSICLGNLIIRCLGNLIIRCD